MLQTDRTLETLVSYPNISDDPETFRYISVLEHYHMFQYLERIVEENELYDHIAVYYPEKQKVMATKWGVSDIEEFPDNIMPLYTGHENEWETFFLVDPINSPDESTTISLVKNIPYGFGGKPKAIVCIKISSKFFEILRQSMDYLGGDYCLLNQNSNLIYSNTEWLDSEIWNAVKKMQSSPEFVDNMLYHDTVEINGSPHLLSLVKSTKGDFVYCHYIPLKDITAGPDRLLNILLVLLVIIVIISALGAYMPARSVYKAFNDIKSTVSSVSEYQYTLTSSPNELAEKIALIYEDNKALQSQNSSIEISANKYKIYQKSLLFRDFLQNTISFQELDDALQYYENAAIPSDGFYSAVLFSIDEPDTFLKDFTSEQRNLYLENLIQVAATEFSIYFSWYEYVQIGDVEVCFILYADPEHFNEESATEQFSLSSQLIHERIMKDNTVSLTVGISETVTEIEMLPSCYKQITQIRDGRWLFGFGKVMTYAAIETSSKQFVYPYEIEGRLLDGLKACRESVTMDCLAEFYSTITDSSHMDIRLVHHCILQLLSTTYRCLFDFYPSVLSQLPGERDVYVDILQETTAQQMYVKLRDIYSKIFSTLGKRASSSAVHTVQSMKEYINESYMDEITLEGMAEQFHLSASHLRRIFKEKTGISIKEYIDNVRMEQASKLLINTSQSISEIALQTGYVSQQTFIRVFKKHFGVTPGEYRK